MNLFLKTVAVSSFCLGLAVSMSVAAESEAKLQSGNLVRSSEVVGAKLFNEQGEHLGEINDVLFDENSGGVTHGVVAAGGFLGIGEKLTAVPWRYVRPTEKARHEYVVKLDKAKLAGGEAVDRNSWPDLNDDWMRRSYNYYGLTAKGPLKLVRASKAVGAELYNQKGEKIGSLHDLLMSPATGKVGFGVASLPADDRGNRDLIAVPWSLIRQSKDATTGYVLNVEQAKLEKGVFFGKDNFPEYNDRDWGEKVSDYWGAARDWWKDNVF